MPDRPNRRWRVQFGMRTLLLTLTLVAAGMGLFGARWYRNHLRQQAISTIRAMGGVLVETRQHGVERVYFGSPQFGNDELRRVVPHLQSIYELQELDLVRVSVTDQGIDTLAGLRHIERLYVFETALTDSGIEQLRTLLPQVSIKTTKPDPIATALAAAKIYPHAIVGLAWSPSGEQLVSGSGDGLIRVWDPELLEPEAEWRAHSDWAFAVAFSPCGSLLATGGGDNVIRLWDTSTWKAIGELRGHTNDVHALAFTLDGATLISGGDDRTIRIWDVAERAIRKVVQSHNAPVTGLAISPDGSTFASASRDDSVKIWDRVSGRLVATLSGHVGDVMSITFSPTGRHLASAGYDGTIRVWELEKRELLQTLTRHKGRSHSVAYDASGQMLASAGADGVRVWHASTASETPWLDQRLVSRVAFHPTRSWLATSNANGELRLLNPVSGKTLSVHRTMYGERGLNLPWTVAIGLERP